MADEQSRNNDIKLMEERAQTISKDDIWEAIGKDKPFTLLKELINNKTEHLSDKFSSLVPNDIFVLSDSECSTENDDEDESPNEALLKSIENNGKYLRKVLDGTSKGVAFSERLETLKVLPLKKNWADCFGGIRYNWEKKKRIWWILYKRIDVWVTYNRTWKKSRILPV